MPGDLNPKVDAFLQDGCGRCSLHATPQCKVNAWRSELKLLRKLMIGCKLTEDRKWGFPCYTVDGKNIVMLAAWKDNCSISFFKGSLMKDPQKMLVKPGENSQAARLLRFRSTDEIKRQSPLIKMYVQEAIDLEKLGAKVDFKAKSELKLPEELEQKFTELPAFRDAFEALTPGRQRGYVLHFSGAKQSQTRTARIEKCMPLIFEGRGLHD